MALRLFSVSMAGINSRDFILPRMQPSRDRSPKTRAEAAVTSFTQRSQLSVVARWSRTNGSSNLGILDAFGQLQSMWPCWQFSSRHFSLASVQVAFATQDIEELVETCDECFFLTSVDFHPLITNVWERRPSPLNLIDDGIIREADRNFDEVGAAWARS